MSDNPAQAVPTEPPPGPIPPRRSRWRRRLILLGAGALAMLIAAELVARLVLRLGDPPLYMADAQIEYLMVPGRTYHRFNAVSTYNRWSMRGTPDIDQRKTDPREVRVLVMGDSVVNGGPQVGDDWLATAHLKPRIAKITGRPAVVANISAGSWGPPNLLAYAKRFGFFEADIVVIVLNHEDATDVPTFGPLGPDTPTRAPLLALEEIVFRYIPAWLGDRSGAGARPEPSTEARLALEDQSLGALGALVAAARASGAKVVGVLHAARSEATGEPRQGTLRLRTTLRDLGVPIADTSPFVTGAMQMGLNVYRDDIHLRVEGQIVLADAIEEAVGPLLPR